MEHQHKTDHRGGSDDVTENVKIERKLLIKSVSRGQNTSEWEANQGLSARMAKVKIKNEKFENASYSDRREKSKSTDFQPTTPKRGNELRKLRNTSHRPSLKRRLSEDESMPETEIKEVTESKTESKPKRAAAVQAIIKNRVILWSPEEGAAQRAMSIKPTPSKSVTCSAAENTPMGQITPRLTRKRVSLAKTPYKSEMTPQMARTLFRSGKITPSIQARESIVDESQTELQVVREALHVSTVPSSLPCRKTEFDNIYVFVHNKIVDGSGGCIYISGVPGTGKTATVTRVMEELRFEMRSELLSKFEYVDINGMHLTEPRQAYVQIHRQLTGQSVPWQQARELLDERFTKTKGAKGKGKGKAITTILLIDELDILCNRKQDVVYSLFEWTSQNASRLVAITIANTMDLPERILKLKVASRLGLTRVTFHPYTFKQLQEIVMDRLAGSGSFDSDAVQLAARKVASVSGDCRRALDICRRATEIAEEAAGNPNAIVELGHVQQALGEMFASPKIRAIQNCSRMEKLFLQAVAAEVDRTGIEEVAFDQVYRQLESLAVLHGISKPPRMNQALEISLNLGASRLLIVQDSSADIFQKIMLNVSVDDLYFALKQQ